MRLSEWVEKKDVDEAVRLIKIALQQSATDPTTGEINMDIITTGQTKTSTDRLKMICEFIKRLQKDYKDKVSSSGLKYGNLLDFIHTKAKAGEFGDKETVIQETEFRDALRNLEEDNVISIFGNSRAPVIRFTNVE
jgi:DNA replication licensing factor MCM4